MKMYIPSYYLFTELFMYMVAPNSPRSLQGEVTISELQMCGRVLKGSLTCSGTQNRACSLLSPWIWLWCVHHHFILPVRLTTFQWPWRRCLARASLHKTQLQWILQAWRTKLVLLQLSLQWNRRFFWLSSQLMTLVRIKLVGEESVKPLPDCRTL